MTHQPKGKAETPLSRRGSPCYRRQVPRSLLRCLRALLRRLPATRTKRPPGTRARAGARRREALPLARPDKRVTPAACGRSHQSGSSPETRDVHRLPLSPTCIRGPHGFRGPKYAGRTSSYTVPFDNVNSRPPRGLPPERSNPRLIGDHAGQLDIVRCRQADQPAQTSTTSART